MKSNICKNTYVTGSNACFFFFFFNLSKERPWCTTLAELTRRPRIITHLWQAAFRKVQAASWLKNSQDWTILKREPGEFLSLFISLGCWLRCCCACFDLRHGLSALKFASCHLISRHYIDWPLSTPNCGWLTVSLSVGSSGWTHHKPLSLSLSLSLAHKLTKSFHFHAQLDCSEHFTHLCVCISVKHAETDLPHSSSVTSIRIQLCDSVWPGGNLTLSSWSFSRSVTVTC